jgi:cobalt/nickel transport system ATP-binding protein
LQYEPDVLIALEKVTFGYQRRPDVLCDCSLTLRAGERIGISGPIGAGKTTLLWLIVGLLRPTQGRIFAFGRYRQREADFAEVRRRAGLLFQDPDDQLFCPTVIEDVTFGPLNLGKSRKEAIQTARQILEKLGLHSFESRITYHLSGGEKRLVALASVLAMQPDVLLLDEPTSGLDPQAADRVLRVLQSLPQAMIVVSHDWVILDLLCTGQLRLEEGQLRPWPRNC